MIKIIKQYKCSRCGKTWEEEDDIEIQKLIQPNERNSYICMDCAVKGGNDYIKWLNSKGHSIVTVKCGKCGKEHETVIENVDKERALKEDKFLCGDCTTIKAENAKT